MGKSIKLVRLFQPTVNKQTPVVLNMFFTGIFFIIFTSIAPFLLVLNFLLGVVANIDVYQYALVDIIPSKIFNTTWFWVLMKCGSVALGFPCFIEGGRLIPIMCGHMVMGAELLVRSIGICFRADIQNLGRLSMLHAKFLQIEVVNQIIQLDIEAAVFALVGFGTGFMSILIFASIRLRHLPLLPYSMFPLLVTLISFIARLSLPVAIAVCENSKSCLRKWRRIVASYPREKVWTRRLKASRGMHYHAGIKGYTLFHLDKSIMSEFSKTIVDYSVDLLLSFPEDEYTFQLD